MITETQIMEATTPDGIFVARQPVFDRNKNIWGYELLFRKCAMDPCADILDPDAATSSIIADGFVIGSKGVGAEKKICINFSVKTLLEMTALALPPDVVCLEFPASDAESVPWETLSLLHQKGYRMVLDDYQGQDLDSRLFELVELIKISFSQTDPRLIMRIRSKLKAHKDKLAAMKLEDWTAFEGAKALGFQYFQGHFFSQPELVSGRKAPSAKITRLRLMKALYSEDLDAAQLVKMLSADPALVYRLLRYINSPGFGLLVQVTSLAHAANLLGFAALKNWAIAAIIADIDCSDKGSELSWTATQRAFFLRRAAENGLVRNISPDAIFLFGLFSNLDALMGMTMDQVLAELPLEAGLKALLLEKSSRNSPWISLLECLESGRSEDIQACLARLGMPAGKAAALYMEASRLTCEALHGTERLTSCGDAP